MSTTNTVQDTPVACPCCGKPSDSVKCYRLGFILFLFIAVVSQLRNEVACAACMRGKIALFAAVNIITANVIWPFVILPLSLGYLIASATRGHSREVQECLR